MMALFSFAGAGGWKLHDHDDDCVTMIRGDECAAHVHQMGAGNGTKTIQNMALIHIGELQ